MTTSIHGRCTLLLLVLALQTAFLASTTNAQPVDDYTNRIAGAAGDDAQYWRITTANHNANIVCDTWSVRGSTDGSDMVPPFMEVASVADHLPLSDLEVRHQPVVSGLPLGQYRLTMRVRCYDQRGLSLPSGASVWVNGVEADACADALTGVYNGQRYTYKTVSVDFDVAADGRVDFGLNLTGCNFDWVAWRDVTLIRTGGPLTDGDYVVRHRQTGIYFDAGGMWGTQLTAGQHPRLVTIESDGSGTFHLRLGFNHYGTPAGLKIVDGAAWVDESSTPWILSPTADGAYTIRSAVEGTYLGYYDGDRIISVGLTDPDVAEAQWELISRRQMLAHMTAADAAITPSSPFDATFLISNPRYDNNAYADAWVFDTTNHNISGEAGGGAYEGNFCAESWNTTFNVYQSLTGIPNGRYRLSVQGLYRYNYNDENINRNALTAHNNGTERLLASLYANDASTPLQSICDERRRIAQLGVSISTDPNGGGMPYSMADAARCFTAGLYGDNVVEVDVTNHQLKIGVRKTERDGCDWTCWDNFVLTLLQPGDNSGYDYGDGPADNTDYSDVTPDNPMDMTDRLQNANCQSSGGWLGSPTYGGQQDNRCAEGWNKNFDVYQELKNMPDGYYRLTAQGFYRYGSYFEEWGETYNGWGEMRDENLANNVKAMARVPWAIVSRRLGREELYARLYMNDAEQPLPSVFDYAHPASKHPDDHETEFGFVPNTMSAASRAFTDGEYPVELTAYIHGGTLRLGIRKAFGYKDDWAIWDNFHLYYLGNQAPDNEQAERIDISPVSLRLDLREQQQLSADVLPHLDGYTPVCWTSADPAVATVSSAGVVTAVSPGLTTIEASLYGLTRTLGTVSVEVCEPTGSPVDIVINEIQVSNVDMFIDPSFNYGSYVELYNPTDRSIPLDGLWLTIDPANPTQKRLTQQNGYVKAHGYALLWFDHANDCPTQHPDRLDMDGGTVSLSDGNGRVIATQAYPAAVTRTSYARTTDGGSTWAVTSFPTPGRDNATCREYLPQGAAPRLPLPVVSHTSQLFTAPFTLMVDIPAGATLFYTTDGSTPVAYESEVSPDGTFDVSQTTTLRLLLAQPGLLNSPVRTLSFILADRDYTLPVLSVVSAPEHFYDDRLGVFVTGTNGKDGNGGAGAQYACNWNMEWDRPVAFNYFTLDGSQHHDQEAALERFGGWSRSYYPYNFKLKAQKQYEDLNYIAHQYFPQKDHLKHKTLQVRNGGNDLLSRIKDVAMQQIILTSGFHLDCQDYQPVHNFVNGQYVGMLNLREPSNKHFGVANYGLDTDAMDAMELGGNVNVTAGTDEAFKRWQSLSAQATDADVYRQIGDMVDIDEFINYMVAETYLGGDDWPGNNCKAFKGNDGKFHIVFFDVDQALRYDANALRHMTDNRGCPLVTIFLNMLNNPTFRKQFVDTYCIFGGSVMEPQRCHDIIDRLQAEMDPALALEDLSTEPTATYMRQVLTAQRQQKMIQSLRSWSYTALNRVASANVTLASNISAARLLVNGIPVPTGRFSGTLFVPTVLMATAPEGYAFQGWQDADGNVVSTTEEFDISDRGDLQLTAVYEPLPNGDDLLAALALPVKVNEVSAGNTVFVSDQWKHSDWFELYNNTDEPLNFDGLFVSDDISQPFKHQIAASSTQNTVVPARGHLVVWADDGSPVLNSQFSTQFHAPFKLSNTDGQLVLVCSSDAFVNNNVGYFSRHPELKAFVDGMTYVAHRGDQSISRYPDGGSAFYQTWRPTIDRPNALLTADLHVGDDVSLMSLLPDGFTLELAEGWNWTSHPLYTPLIPADLPASVQRIVGQSQEAFRDARLGFTGTLQSLDAGHLYKVLSTADAVFTSSGSLRPSNLPVALRPGWNWVGYPVSGAQTVADALADYLAEEGDHLVGQDGFATFDGTQWVGTLSTLETGRGYLLFTRQAKSLTFRAPQVQVNLSRRHSQSSILNSQFSILNSIKHSFPNVMGIIACLVDADGAPADASRFTVCAYADGSLRGRSASVADRTFITVYGNGGEPLTYQAVDNLDGTVYDIVETALFIPGVEGTLRQPCPLTLGNRTATTVGGAAALPLPLSPFATTPAARPVGYYSLSGVLLSRSAASLPQGTYVVRYADGSHRKIQVP